MVETAGVLWGQPEKLVLVSRLEPVLCSIHSGLVTPVVCYNKNIWLLLKVLSSLSRTTHHSYWSEPKQSHFLQRPVILQIIETHFAFHAINKKQLKTQSTCLLLQSHMNSLCVHAWVLLAVMKKSHNSSVTFIQHFTTPKHPVLPICWSASCLRLWLDDGSQTGPCRLRTKKWVFKSAYSASPPQHCKGSCLRLCTTVLPRSLCFPTNCTNGPLVKSKL